MSFFFSSSFPLSRQCSLTDCKNLFTKKILPRFTIHYQANIWPRSDLFLFLKDVIGDVCDPCNDMYLIHGNQHSLDPKKYKNQNFGNNMESDTESKGSKDREIAFINTKVWKKIKEKVFKRRILIEREGVQKKKDWFIVKRKVILILLLKDLSYLIKYN